jgi:hypothetical protein
MFNTIGVLLGLEPGAYPLIVRLLYMAALPPILESVFNVTSLKYQMEGVAEYSWAVQE